MKETNADKVVVGNPLGNSLSACQLSQLHSLAQDAMPSTNSGQITVAFWIDTLCVPVSRAARQKALSLIRQTFNEADCTHVLDYEIEQLPMATHIDEAVWRLSLSDWGRRLWTCEEFLVSGNRVLLKCKDGLLNIRQSYSESWSSLLERCRKLYSYDPYDMLGTTELMFLRAESQGYSAESRAVIVRYLMRHARQLSTSRWEDETLCLASVVDLDTAPLAALAPEDRMEKFTRAVSRLPTTIAFGTGPRMQKPGFRWAPTSFLTEQEWPQDTDERDGCNCIEPELESLPGFLIKRGGYDITRCATRIGNSAPLWIRTSEKSPRLSLRYRKECDTLPFPGVLSLSAREMIELLYQKGEGRVFSFDFMPIEFPSSPKLIVFKSNLQGVVILVHSMGKIHGCEKVQFIARADLYQSGYPEDTTDKLPVERTDWTNGGIVYVVPIPEQFWLIT